MWQLNKSAQELFVNFAERVGIVAYSLRKKHDDVSYEEFAKRHNISRSQYWRMEEGKSNLTIKSLCALLDAHDLSIDEFLTLLIDVGSKSLEDIRQERKALSMAKRGEKTVNSFQLKTPTKSIFEMGKLPQVDDINNWGNDADWLEREES